MWLFAAAAVAQSSEARGGSRVGVREVPLGRGVSPGIRAGHAMEARTCHLQHMAKVRRESCLNVLGTEIQLDGGHDAEFRQVTHAEWKRDHSKTAL